MQTRAKTEIMGRRAALAIALVAAAATAPAQAAPGGTDAGSLLETVKPVPPPPPRPQGPLFQPPVETRPALEADKGLRVTFRAFRFSGVTAFREDELQALVDADRGHELGFAQMQELAARVTRYYREHGYFVARAYLPQQEIGNGTLEIAVLEGRIAQVQVRYESAGPRMSPQLLGGLVTGAVPTAEPITVAALERAMLLENDLPNLNAHATLVPGASVGTTDLVLEAKQSGWFSHNTLEADNAGNRYSGSARFGGSVNLASPAGLGDLLTARALSSFRGFDYGRVSWTVPLGTTGLKGGVSGTYSDYRLRGALAAAKDRGDARVASVFTVYPLVRSRGFNLYQTATFEHKELYDIAITGPLADKHISQVSLGLNGDASDEFAGGGLSSFSVTVEKGNLGLGPGAADIKGDAATARTRGSYAKLSVQAVRQQRLTEDWVLYGSINGQVASKNLDSSESLPMGGPGGVRAYPTGESPADEGLIASLELRYNTIAPRDWGSLQWQLFLDSGNVKLHRDPWSSYVATRAPNCYDLKSLGVGVNLYRENSLMVSASVAHKLGVNPNPGLGEVDADGRHLSTRWWVQITKYL